MPKDPAMSADPTPALPPYPVVLVMIARDEAPRIERALRSFAPWVQRLLVLDTGSRDDTVAIARAAGAEVHQGGWRGDFSAARNEALALAGGAWHLVVDADEWLAEGGEALAALSRTAPDFVGALRVDSLQDGDAGTAPSWISRLLPGPVRYQGRVHEQPQHALPVRRLPIHLGHDGYLAAARAAKDGRNADLLRQALAEQPRDAYLWYQLGKDHDVYGRHAQALEAFGRAEALLGPGCPPWRHDLVVRSLHALKCCGRHAEGAERAEAGLRDWSHSPDFFFALGDLLLDWAAERPALADALLPTIEQAWQRCLDLGERPDLEGAVAGRGSTLARRNLDLLHSMFPLTEASR